MSDASVTTILCIQGAPKEDRIWSRKFSWPEIYAFFRSHVKINLFDIRHICVRTSTLFKKQIIGLAIRRRPIERNDPFNSFFDIVGRSKRASKLGSRKQTSFLF